MIAIRSSAAMPRAANVCARRVVRSSNSANVRTTSPQISAGLSGVRGDVLVDADVHGAPKLVRPGSDSVRPRARLPHDRRTRHARRRVPRGSSHRSTTTRARRPLGAADYVDALLGAFTFDPPRIWAGGPFSGRAGGDASFERFLPLSRVEELAWRTRIEGSQGHPEREFNGPVVGWQEQYRDGLAALGADFRRSGRRRAGPPPRRRSRASSTCSTSTRARRCYGAPEYGGNRDLAGWTRDRLRRRRATPRLDRRRGRPAVPDRDADVVIVGSGPGGATAARRAHRRGLVGDRAREGSQPPARARTAVRPARPRLATTRSSSRPRYFLGPDPLLEPRTFRRTEADGDRTLGPAR